MGSGNSEGKRCELAVEAALALIARGGAERERGVLVLDEAMGKRLERYFLRHKVHADDAEELVWDVLYRATKEFRGETRAIVWLWIIARNVLISHHRSRNPEVQLDDEDWESLLNHRPAPGLPQWLRLCIERVLWAFERDFPERAETVRMIVEEWSAREIAAYFGTSEGAARDRVYRTRLKLEPYLAQCEE